MKLPATLTLALLGFASTAGAAELFSQPHDGSGTLYQSSWFSPDDSDWDQHVWDNFTLATTQAITEIRWRGGYIYHGQYSPTVADFTVAIWANSIANEPEIISPPLVEYQTGGNAGQTPAGVFGGFAMYDYHFTLPAAFEAQAGVKYWVYILAAQNGIPEWGLAKGGLGSHFRWLRGAHMYQFISGDAAFTLIGLAAPCVADIVPGSGVNVDDLLAVINAWGACGNPTNCPADIAPAGGNDVVDVDDLLAVINAWGNCP